MDDCCLAVEGLNDNSRETCWPSVAVFVDFAIGKKSETIRRFVPFPNQGRVCSDQNQN